MKTLYVLIFLLLVSCRPPSYYPSKQALPILKKKGNVQFSAGIGSGFEYQFQIAASPVVGLGLYGGVQNVLPGYSSRKHSNYEGGLGYYVNTATRTHYSIYGSFSTGRVDAHDDNRYVENDFKRYSLTITSAPQVSGWQVSTSIRGEYNRMKNYLRYEMKGSEKKITSSGDRDRMFVGPIIGAAYFGKSGHGIQTQFGSSIPLEKSTLHKSVLSMYFYASASVLFDMNF